MALFEMAHSLGYPHPNVMLRQMTAGEYCELLKFVHLKAGEKDRREAEAEEMDIKNFLGIHAARQKADNGG